MSTDRNNIPGPVEMPEDVRLAIEQLRELTDSDVPKLPEHLFRQHLLPVLTNTSGNVDLRIWLDIAGAANRPIDVVDGAGKVLFRVPALIRYIPTRLNGSPRDSLSQLLATAKLQSERHPALGNAYLKSALETKDPRVGPDLESAKQWSAILVRYGYPPLPIPGLEPAVDDSQKTASEGRSIFSDEYEEL